MNKLGFGKLTDAIHVWIPPEQYEIVVGWTAGGRVTRTSVVHAIFPDRACPGGPFDWVLRRPPRSVVMIVKASEIVRSDNYACGYTLRFPRFVGIHPSKRWDECMTLEGRSRAHTHTHAHTHHPPTAAETVASVPHAQRLRIAPIVPSAL